MGNNKCMARVTTRKMNERLTIHYGPHGWQTSLFFFANWNALKLVEARDTMAEPLVNVRSRFKRSSAIKARLPHNLEGIELREEGLLLTDSPPPVVGTSQTRLSLHCRMLP